MKTSEVAMKNHKVRGSSIIPAIQKPQRIVTSLFTCVVFYYLMVKDTGHTQATQTPHLPWLTNMSIYVPVVREEKMNMIKDCVNCIDSFRVC